jgi:hypothetical protein
MLGWRRRRRMGVGVDYLTRSMRPSNRKEHRRRGGGAASKE